MAQFDFQFYSDPNPTEFLPLFAPSAASCPESAQPQQAKPKEVEPKEVEPQELEPKANSQAHKLAPAQLAQAQSVKLGKKLSAGKDSVACGADKSGQATQLGEAGELVAGEVVTGEGASDSEVMNGGKAADGKQTANLQLMGEQSGVAAAAEKQPAVPQAQAHSEASAEGLALAKEGADGLGDYWQRASSLLLGSLGADNYERWFEEVQLRSLDEQVALFAVPNSIYSIWIETNYQEELMTAMAAVTGRQLVLKFEVDPNMEAQPTGSKQVMSQVVPKTLPSVDSFCSESSAGCVADDEHQELVAQLELESEASIEEPIDAEEELASARSRPQLSEKALAKAGILAKFCLDSFVVGESNRYAFAAVSAVADAPAKAYNPLFLHSRSGLGKTHLLHAIGHKVLSRNPRARVIYRTSEQWVNEFLEAIERRSLSAFRARYRNIDVLLLDDVQFLAGKDHCKSEFFHTFNTLFDGHKQIVLSSDRPASEIRDLEPRLRSRFDCGLTAEMEVPNREVRLAILNSKAQHFAATIKPEIMEFLAQRINSDVRTLEGALVRVASYIQITQREPSLSELEHQLRDLLGNCSSELCINDIQRVVSEHFGVSLTEMSSRRRQAQIVYPRQVAMLLSRQLTASTLKEIGEAFGGRDHGTVLHAVRKLDEIQGQDRQQLQADVEEIKRQLNLS